MILSMGGERIDTRSPTGKLMLTMLAAVAEFERGLMLERQREGIARAKAAAPTGAGSRPRGQMADRAAAGGPGRDTG